MNRFKALFLAFSLLVSTDAFCFPEMVRHGYVNCTACHVSPSGGGVLSAYGRELSKELLSTWGRDGEQAFAYGLIKPPENVNLGGDYRQAYIYDSTPQVQEGRPLFMQADIEGAVNFGKWTLDAMVGYQNPTQAMIFSDHLLSRRHYVMYHLTDELTLRGGRFYENYGINMPDHTVLVRGGLSGSRQGLGINDEGYETYNLEGAFIGDKYNVFITGIFGRPDAPQSATQLDREKGVSINSSFALHDTYKVGASYLYSQIDTSHRHVMGPYGILGFTPHFFLLTELDYQIQTPVSGNDSQSGIANYQRLDYEVVQGLHAYITQEFGRLNFADTGTIQKAYGVGAQFFPRPHFEFNFEWQKQYVPTLTSDYIDVAWLILHFYP